MTESDTVTAAKVDSTPKEQTAWCTTVAIFVAKKNGEDPTQIDGYAEHVGAARRGPLVTIQQGTQDEIFEEIHVANFWPKEDLVHLNLPVPIADKELKSGTDKFGNTCLGLLRPASASDPDPLPRSVKPIMKKQLEFSSRVADVDKSSDHTRVGQGDAAWAAQQRRLDVSVQPVSGAGGASTSCLVSAAAQDSESDSDGGFAPAVGFKLGGMHVGPAADIEPATLPAVVASQGRKRKTSASKESPVKKPGGEGGATKRKASPISATPAAKKVCTWRDRQKVVRELQAADKVLTSMEQVRKQFKSDSSSITVGELVALKKKVAARLEPNVHGVYCGEDSEGPDGEIGVNEQEELADRGAKISVFKKAEGEVDAMHSLGKNLSATKLKDQVNFAPNAMKTSLADCRENGVGVSADVYKTYMERLVENEFDAIISNFTDAWRAIDDLLHNPVTDMTHVSMLLPSDAFCDLLSLLSAASDTSPDESEVLRCSQQSAEQMGDGIPYIKNFLPENECSDVQLQVLADVSLRLSDMQLFHLPESDEEHAFDDDEEKAQADLEYNERMVEAVHLADRHLFSSFLSQLANIVMIPSAVAERARDTKTMISELVSLATADMKIDVTTLTDLIQSVCKPQRVLSKCVGGRLGQQTIERH